MKRVDLIFLIMIAAAWGVLAGPRISLPPERPSFQEELPNATPTPTPTPPPPFVPNDSAHEDLRNLTQDEKLFSVTIIPADKSVQFLIAGKKEAQFGGDKSPRLGARLIKHQPEPKLSGEDQFPTNQ